MKHSKSVAALATLGALIGCSSLLGGELVRQGEPVGAITIMNESGSDIDALTISRCSAASHGLDMLTNGMVIAHGTSRTWQVNAGCWDIMVGKSGYCTPTCRWQQGSAKVQVLPNQTFVSRWGPAPPN